MAVRKVWNEIDKAFDSEIEKDLVRLRLYKKEGSFEELYQLVSVCGDWVIRSNEYNSTITAHIVGKLKRRSSLASTISFLKEHGWIITNMSCGA
jgi:hypothetical protein